jgi:hypothetical protein
MHDMNVALSVHLQVARLLSKRIPGQTTHLVKSPTISVSAYARKIMMCWLCHMLALCYFWIIRLNDCASFVT